MFKTRLLSGIALVIILGGAIYLGGFYLWTLLFLISIIGFHEFSRAVGTAPFSKMEVLGLLSAASYDAVLLFFPFEAYLFLTLIAALILFMGLYVFTFPKYDCTVPIQLFFGLVYVAAMLGFLYLIRIRENGLIEILLVFASSWVSDTFAYLSGRALGKHKLAPVLSPKKSVEGAVGGVLGSVAAGLILAYFAKMSLPAYAIAAGIGAVISQIGDLFASGIKRNKGIKDYGALIPGHGGILDRFDSVIITAPIIYYCCVFLL